MHWFVKHTIIIYIGYQIDKFCCKINAFVVVFVCRITEREI
jgi:hypothetical protein